MRISDWSSDVCSSDLPTRHGRSISARSFRPPSASPAEIAMPLHRLCLLLIALLLPLLLLQPAHAADYFGKPDATENAASGPVAAPSITLPAPLARALGVVVSLQSALNAKLRAALAAARDGTSWRPAFAIVLLSFLYGVFHAVGPGHGKAVLGSYFLTRRAQVLHGLGASFLSAAVQAVSAIVLVGQIGRAHV